MGFPTGGFYGVAKGELFGQNTDIFTIVSCSFMSPVKRVPLIAESLSHIEFPIKWVHFGDGEEMHRVLEIVDTLPSNVKVELAGGRSNEDILNYYRNNKVDAFIHLSSSEGFGMAIVEAFSFGIPGILYPGGAVKDD
ncbi:MAG: glycosyltransferase [Crocinitomicaceae bacterium]|nr:glycosyltransferase [Crocinitomicaceae bacterium]